MSLESVRGNSLRDKKTSQRYCIVAGIVFIFIIIGLNAVQLGAALYVNRVENSTSALDGRVFSQWIVRALFSAPSTNTSHTYLEVPHEASLFKTSKMKTVGDLRFGSNLNNASIVSGRAPYHSDHQQGKRAVLVREKREADLDTTAHPGDNSTSQAPASQGANESTLQTSDDHIMQSFEPQTTLTSNHTINSTNTDTVNSTKPDTVNSTKTDTVNSTKTDTVNSTKTDTVNSTNTDTVNSTKTDTVNSTNTDTVNSTKTDTVNSTITPWSTCPLNLTHTCDLNSTVCLHHGNSGDYTCNCRPGFVRSGYANESLCIDMCSPNPCDHDGKCDRENGQVKCRCPEDWTGERCANLTDEARNYRLAALVIGTTLSALVALLILFCVVRHIKLQRADKLRQKPTMATIQTNSNSIEEVLDENNRA